MRPPFLSDAPYDKAIREYRANLIAKYSDEQAPDDDLGAWFRAHRGADRAVPFVVTAELRGAPRRGASAGAAARGAAA
jgi:hypothetical protein